ncbi:MAG: glycerophosphoryl diester phosphodiesterase membrane domain-containing protein [Peptoniphilaceae bacterium]|jgi:glycerophosphoryl diester phosphodiesterase
MQTEKPGKSYRLRKILPLTLSTFLQDLPQFLTYQIWTKLLFSVVLLPSFWLFVRFLMSRRGMHVITNSTIAEFMLHKEGALLAGVALLLLFLGIILELFGFVTISARALHDAPEVGYLSLVWTNLKQIPKLMGFGGLLLVLYLLLFVPLSGTGVGLSFISVRIPNFITAVIESNPAYLAAYGLIVLIALLLSIRWIFTLHFIVIGNLRPLNAMRASAVLYRDNRKVFLKTLLFLALLGVFLSALIVLGWFIGIQYLIEHLDFEKVSARSVMVGLLLLQTLSIFLTGILIVPFDVHVLTVLFYRFTKNHPRFSAVAGNVPWVPKKTKDSLLDHLTKKRGRLILLSLLLLTAMIALSQGLFHEFFIEPHDTQVVAHRGGGFARAENSLLGLQHAIRTGADYTEVDIQRTKDGHYVLHHDTRLKRILGIGERVDELTLDEIRQKTPEENRADWIPALPDFLDKSIGHIRVMLELKGPTADTRMAEDVIRMIRDRAMEQDAVILSLDYRLIQYIEQKHPDIQTGFIYFLSIGDIAALDGDYLILEEGIATPDRIAEIREAGKKSVVWTVNQPKNMDTFIDRGVDAIITDEVRTMQGQLTISQAKTARDRMLEMFIPK